MAPFPPRRPRRITPLWIGAMLFGRMLFAAFLVFATYNPTGRSTYHWLVESHDLLAWKVVASGLLLLGFGVVIPVVVRALGLVGMLLTISVTTTSIWLLIETGLVAIADWRGQAWVVLSVIATVLGVGLGWMTIARTLDGQLRTVDISRP
jgi:hypothetical protein